MFSPIKTGRLKKRVNVEEKVKIYSAAQEEVTNNIFPDLKKFINELPWYKRIQVAFLIIIGRF